MFTEIYKKRKSDIFQSLGKNKSYAISDSFKDYLFDKNTMKKMNQDLKNIYDKYGSRNFCQPPKNRGSSYKTQKSRIHRGKNKQYHKQWEK